MSSPTSGQIGDKIRPDVAGNSELNGTRRFTIVWERVYTSTDHDVHGRQVTNDTNPTLIGSGDFLVDNSSGFESQPQISSCVGVSNPSADSQKAMVVYVRGGDVRGRLVRWDGVMHVGFLVAGGTSLQSQPTVSSRSTPDAAGNILYLVAWRQGYVTDGGDTGDIKVALCSQRSQRVSPVYVLHSVEGGGHIGWDQFRPRAACSGCRFVVAYGEDYQDSGDLDVRASTLHARQVSSNSWALGISEARVQVAFRSTVETDGALCAEFEGAWDRGARGGDLYPDGFRFLWVDDNGATANEIRSILYEGTAPGTRATRIDTRCGLATAGIGYAGEMTLGMSFYVATFQRTFPLPPILADALLVGTPITPVPICPPLTCRLGVQIVAVTGPEFRMIVPCDPGLLGGSLAFQGVVASGGSCFGALSLTDTIVLTVR